MVKCSNSFKQWLLVFLLRGFATPKNNLQFTPAFTLAEVLITLGIIGIVAAMTIPNLISSYTERVRITKLKKAYSVLSNAYNLARSEYGPIEHWDLPQSNDYQNYTIAIGEKFRRYMKHELVCQTRAEFQKCFTGGYNGLNEVRNGFLDGTGHGGASYHTFTSNGLVYSISPYYNDLSNIDGVNKIYYAGLTVYLEPHLHTTAGYKYGKNVFQFLLTNQGVFPGGDGDSLPEAWYANVPLRFKLYCVKPDGSLGRGQGCTKWAVTKGNMDYLKCPEKIAKGAQSCKE